MKMLVFHCFYKVLVIPPRNNYNACFDCVLMTFAAECANVRADGPEYRESLDMRRTAAAATADAVGSARSASYAGSKR